jgi:hypothetical protein
MTLALALAIVAVRVGVALGGVPERAVASKRETTTKPSADPLLRGESPGNDDLVGGDGDDRITADDGYYDEVTCGPGYDTADAAYGDKVGSSCEDV